MIWGPLQANALSLQPCTIGSNVPIWSSRIVSFYGHMYLSQQCYLPKQEHLQCDQIGQFFKVFVRNFTLKVAQTYWDFLDFFKKHHFLILNCGGYFLGNFFKSLGYFLFQNLVTLNICLVIRRRVNFRFVKQLFTGDNFRQLVFAP